MKKTACDLHCQGNLEDQYTYSNWNLAQTLFLSKEKEKNKSLSILIKHKNIGWLGIGHMFSRLWNVYLILHKAWSVALDTPVSFFI